MRLEEVLPALREGKRIRRESWHPWRFVRIHEGRLVDELRLSVRCLGKFINADDWEIVPEPTRVADYLVPHSSTKCRPYVVTLFGCPNGDPILDELFFKQTHPIGQQPDGAVMVPGSERDARSE